MLKKISNGCVHIVQRYLPDPFIFCILLTIVVFIAAIPAAGATPLQVVGFWGTSIWSLLAFSMQMALVLVLGTAMATAPPVKRLLDKIAGVSTNPMDRPREDQVMEEVTVETFGVDYPEPEKM